MTTYRCPRWLRFRARVWRVLMNIGMVFHKSWSPRPMVPSFTQHILTTLSDIRGLIKLSVYCPADYEAQKRRGFKGARNGAGYPVIINLHGGGFTIGTATDDARFISTAVEQLDCIVVSVDYRLAPEHPFPTAVDDCADAVLWLAEHADQLGIDAQCMAIVGFSSGGNLTLTTPVRLHDHLAGIKRGPLMTTPSSSAQASTVSLLKTATVQARQLGRSEDVGSSISLAPTLTHGTHLHHHSSLHAQPLERVSPSSQAPSFRLRALVPFYPSTNYTLSRAARRATNPSPKHNMLSSLSTLFDDSYLPPTENLRLSHPYLSPGLMSSSHMRDVYSSTPVTLVACEYDMLCAEEADFVARLRAVRAGGECDEGENMESAMPDEGEQDVAFAIVKGAPHAWDKQPFMGSASRRTVQREYDFVCKRLKQAFDA